MYESFEKGVCDTLSLHPSQLCKEARELLKYAFANPPIVPTPKPASGLPGAGNPHGGPSGLPGINPVQEDMKTRVNAAELQGSMKGVTNPSQLHGTMYDGHTKADSVADTAGNIDLAGLGARTAGWGAKFSKTLAPAGEVLGTAGKFVGRMATPISMAMTIPTGLQLGDKANDAMGIQNKWGRGAVRAGTVGASMGSVAGGALLGSMVAPGPGTIIGGMAGAFAPGLVNGMLNRRNQNKMQFNQTQAHSDAMTQEYNRAMQAKQQGDEAPMQAWYGMQSPEELKARLGKLQPTQAL